MKYSVLTYIFNDYEIVHEVVEKDPDAEYILVTDDPNLKSDTWEVVYAEDLKDLSPFDKCYQVRFHPFNYCHTDIVVRVDGSMVILKPLSFLVDKFVKGDYDMALMIHPERNNIKEEYNAWIQYRGYDPKQAKKCLDFMKSRGYQFHQKGLFQFGFAIQKKCAVVESANNTIFSLLKYFGEDGNIERLDQTVVTFVINMLYKEAMIMPVTEDLITNSPYIQWCFHRSNKPIPNKENKIQPFMFNRVCKPII